MRIGFTGAHGTGKTTVKNAMKAMPRFKDFYTPPSSARLLRQRGINKDATPLGQLLITVDRGTNIASHKNVITDRCTIDSWAYTQYQLHHVWDDTDIAYDIVTNKFVASSMKDIDLLVYFPPLGEIKADGTRLVDRKYQSQIDNWIVEGIQKFWGGSFLRLQIEPVETRVKKIIQIAESLK